MLTWSSTWLPPDEDLGPGLVEAARATANQATQLVRLTICLLRVCCCIDVNKQLFLSHVNE